MEYTENEKVAFTGIESIPEIHQGNRIAQGLFLDELPGAAFAGITLFWVLSSFAGLMWREVPATTMLHLQNLAHVLLGSQVVTKMSHVAGMASFAKAVSSFFDPQAPA